MRLKAYAKLAAGGNQGGRVAKALAENAQARAQSVGDDDETAAGQLAQDHLAESAADPYDDVTRGRAGRDRLVRGEADVAAQ